MARYCFYCGQKLEQSEKCHCRERSFASSASYSSSPPASDTTTGNRDTSAPGGYAPPEHQAQGQGREHVNDASQARDHARKESWADRRAKKRAEREAKRSASSHRSKTQSTSSQYYSQQPPYGQRTTQQRQANRVAMLTGFIRFFATPSDVMKQSLSTRWSVSHTSWLLAAVVLSGTQYVNLNRFLMASQSQGSVLTMDLKYLVFSWLTGVLVVVAVIAIFTLTMWLIARFIYRQRGLPFAHTLAVGKISWQYLTLFFALSLPSIFTNSSIFGVILALMGLVFSVMVHARQVASLTRLDDNRSWQFVYLSIIMFAGILSTVATLSRFIPLSR